MGAINELKKNDVHIKQVETIQEEIDKIAKMISDKFNNREMSLVVTKLQEAKMWAGEYIKVLE